jgi:hypothetical protein
MPKEHMNYGDSFPDDGGGKGKLNGSGKGGKKGCPGTGANSFPLADKAFIPPSSKAPSAAVASEPRPQSPVRCKDEIAPKEEPIEEEHTRCKDSLDTQSSECVQAKEEPANDDTHDSKSLAVKAEGESSLPGAHDAYDESLAKEEGTSEIQRRRAALEALAVPKEEEKSEIQRRREALEALNSTSPEEASTEIQGRREALNVLQESTPCAAKDELAKHEPGSPDSDSKRRRIGSVTAWMTPSATAVAAASTVVKAEDPPKATPAAAPAAASGVQQGLQRWASQVNALAGTDADLIPRCREHVRQRILKAHAMGNLHATDWDTEPLPSVDDLRAGNA